MKYFLIITLIILLLIPICLGVYLIIFNHFYHKFFSRKGEFLKSQNDKFKNSQKENSNLDAFKNFEDVKCFSNEIKLRGKYKNFGNDKLAILLHSFGADHNQMGKYCQFFSQQGFDILSIDSRGHGKSEGICSFGQDESDDLLAWVNTMQAINPKYHIVICGIGLGGSVGLLAQNNYPKEVKMVVCESAFSNTQKELMYIINKYKFRPPQKAFLKFLERTKEISVFKNQIIENVKKAVIPIVLMQDADDEIVPIQMGYDLQDALVSFNKNLLTLGDCNHGEGMERQSYKVKSYIEQYLKKYL